MSPIAVARSAAEHLASFRHGDVGYKTRMTGRFVHSTFAAFFACASLATEAHADAVSVLYCSYGPPIEWSYSFHRVGDGVFQWWDTGLSGWGQNDCLRVECRRTDTGYEVSYLSDGGPDRWVLNMTTGSLVHLQNRSGEVAELPLAICRPIQERDIPSIQASRRGR